MNEAMAPLERGVGPPSRRGISPLRAVVVTGGLAVAGGLFGAVAGAAALGAGLLVTDGLEWLRSLSILLIPAMFGGALGSVCAPIAGWLLLREVPLGRAFTGLTIGTVVGGLLGWVVAGPLNAPILTAAAGFLSGAVLMRIRQRRSSAISTATLTDGPTDVP